ncbi:MAG TPA: amino acid adenylation domain-containing protein, partial [Blastocatellia bacterium]|nr:amino acid adenylation domain-containing protein [Blastocatellia bacterium]
SVPIGRPVANVEAYVLNERLEPVPVGVSGELYLGGLGIGRGYLRQPEMTAGRFVPHPFNSRPGARLYRTGDLVRYLPDGNLDFLGRIDNQVKFSGYRIELGEIERVLEQAERVREAAVIVREDDQGDQRLVAYIVGAIEEEGETKRLREYLKEHLPDYMLPSAIVVMDRMPLRPNGKLDRQALPRPRLERGVGNADGLGESTPVTEIVRGIFEEVLKLDQVGSRDNFFEIGGHSLLATQVVSRVSGVFGVGIGVRSIFEGPTVEAVARNIERAMRAGEKDDAPPLVRASREGRLPLSFAQRRLWFLDQLVPDNPFYNMAGALKLEGRLNIAALERAINEIVRRHEVLRTRFEVEENEPVQVIDTWAPRKLKVEDLTSLTRKEREDEARRIARDEAKTGFDLSRGPLLRVKVLKLEAEDHILLYTMHHIVSDGWSMGILSREVGRLYRVFSAEEESPLPELEIQYADYAVWQRNWFQGEALKRQLGYWREQLAELEPLDLPTDYPRPAVASYRGASLTFGLSDELKQQLQALSRHEGVTLFMTLLATFQILLARYSRQERIVVGSPIANRNRREIEGLIGFFVNMLVLRADLRGNQPFRGLLKQVKDLTLGAYAHQDLPFEMLVEEIQPERTLSHNPLFQVTFVLQHTPRSETDLSRAEAPVELLDHLDFEMAPTRFDLEFHLWDQPDGLNGAIVYSRDLFERSRIERMAEHFENLLTGLVVNPDRPISTLPLLSHDECQQVIEGWNGTRVEYPKDLTLGALFEEQVRQTPEATAVSDGAHWLSYRELNARADQLARHLHRFGVRPESVVGLCLERSMEMIISMLAVIKAGGAYLPLDPAGPPERLKFILAEAQPQVLITRSHLPASSVNGVHVACLDRDWAAITGEDEAPLAAAVTPQNLAYVIYTSGSTGRPKGVEASHAGVVNLVRWHQQVFQVTKEDRATQLAGLAFDACGWEIWPYLAAGAAVYLVPEEVRISTAELRDWLVAQEITLCFMPTPLAEDALGAEWPAAMSLRCLLTGGDQLHMYPPSSAPFVLVNNYGPTESSVVTTSGVVESESRTWRQPSIGRPITNTEAYLLDRHWQLVPVGVIGELHIGGLGLARGYLKGSDSTAEKFIPHPFNPEPGARLYRTGDLARYRTDGELEYVGRSDLQVKIRGYRIELGEIEAVLRQHAGVKEAIVVARGE